MFKILVILFCVVAIIFSDDLLSKFQQHDYEIKFTRAEVTTCNKTILKYFKVVTFKFNRSIAAMNITFESKLQLDYSKTHIIVQAYKLLSNEYRTFPMRFQLNICQALDNNIAGSRDMIHHCGNMEDCHIKKNLAYHICNAYPDQSRLPPYFPNGEFKMELIWTKDDAIISISNVYVVVSRPIKIPKY